MREKDCFSAVLFARQEAKNKGILRFREQDFFVHKLFIIHPIDIGNL